MKDFQNPEMRDLPSWAGAGRVAIDIETCDPQLRKYGPGVRRDGYIVGVSFAIEDREAYYLPIRHEGGDNMDPDKVLNYLRDQMAEYDGIVVGAKLPYDLDYLAEAGLEFSDKVKFFRDVQIAEPLLDELQQRYSLEAIAERHGIPGKDESRLLAYAEEHKLHPKRDLWKMPARVVAEYAIRDVTLPLQLLRRQEWMIDREDLWRVYDLESRLLPVMLRMRRRGVRIDFDQLDRVEAWSLEEEQRCLDEIHRLCGVRLSISDVTLKPPRAAALKAVGIDCPLTPKAKQPQIKNEWLKSLNHPVADMLVRAGKVHKLRGTFVESIRAHETNGRIHCTFNQMRREKASGDNAGPRFGRISSTDPNLQQQPSRDDFAKMWRSIYVPDEGMQWACLDFSQQEPRMATHYATLKKCAGARKMADRYIEDPDADNHTIMAQVVNEKPADWVPSKKQREEAKTIFLALCYGMGGAKLATRLGLPTEMKESRYSGGKPYLGAGPEAQEIIDRFNRQVPFIEALAHECKKVAKRRGYIKTLSGRRCRFPLRANGRGYDFLHTAINRLIQGSSADQTKMAVLAVEEAGFPIQLQVHDEIDLSVPNREYAEEAAKIMRECVELVVPSRVDVEIGPSWGQIE